MKKLIFPKFRKPGSWLALVNNLGKSIAEDRIYLGLAVAVFLLGLFSGYTAHAAVTPSQADWDAYAQLKPVKKMNYDKVYEEIEADVNRLSVKESQFAVNLPMQLEGPMKAMRGTEPAREKKPRRNARFR